MLRVEAVKVSLALKQFCNAILEHDNVSISTIGMPKLHANLCAQLLIFDICLDSSNQLISLTYYAGSPHCNL